MAPTSTRIKDVSNWEVSRATNGTIRNCRIFNANPGYGLVQCHGAQSLHFEDIYAKGGVALIIFGSHQALYPGRSLSGRESSEGERTWFAVGKGFEDNVLLRAFYQGVTRQGELGSRTSDRFEEKTINSDKAGE